MAEVARHQASSPLDRRLKPWAARGLRTIRRVGPFLYFLGLTVVFTWPAVRDLPGSIVGQYGDNLYFIWMIGWFQKALFVLHRSPLTTDLLNYPQGWNLASTEMSPGMVLTALPLSLIGGPTLGYNSAALTSFIISGLGMYYWVHRQTQAPWAGMLAGTAFAFSPFRMTEYVVGHLNLLGVQWLPVFFLGLQETLTASPRHPIRWGLVTAAGLALIALSSQYLLYMTLVIAMFVSLVFGVLSLLRVRGFTLPWKGILAWLVPGLPAILLVSAPYLMAAAAGELPVRGIDSAQGYSASPTDYVLPSDGHPIWGDWIGDRFDNEGSLYVGLVTGLLATSGLFALRKQPRGGKIILFHVGIAATSFVLSLGPTLHWLSQPVHVNLPSPFRFLQADDGVSLVLPARVLYTYLPFYSSMRVPMRYGALVMTSASFLAAVGAVALAGRLKESSKYVTVAVLVALVLLDSLPPRVGITQVRGRPVDYWLASQPDVGAVAQLPFREATGEDQVHLFYTLIHGKPYISGLSGSYVTSQHRRIAPVLEGFPDAESLALLRELGVAYVVVDAEWYEGLDALDDVEIALEELGVPLLARAGEQLVYGLADWTKTEP